MWFGVSHLANKIASACNDGEDPPLEETFGVLEVCLRDNQYALGRIQEIPLWEAAHHDVA